jgi:hypothetical protein
LRDRRTNAPLQTSAFYADRAASLQQNSSGRSGQLLTADCADIADGNALLPYFRNRVRRRTDSFWGELVLLIAPRPSSTCRAVSVAQADPRFQSLSYPLIRVIPGCPLPLRQYKRLDSVSPYHYSGLRRAASPTNRGCRLPLRQYKRLDSVSPYHYSGLRPCGFP